MKIAIITGASSGLGAEFARVIAEKYTELDEIWLIARRKDRLTEFTKTYPAKIIRLITLDLSLDSSYGELSAILEQEQPDIQILINNAGYERSGRFDEMNLDVILNMINVNIKGMTAINRICLPYMKFGTFAVITCSVSGFSPIPGLAVYSPSKAYACFHGRSLRQEMKQKGVNVFLLCPGNMDTEMNPRGGTTQSKKLNTLPFLDLKYIAKKSLNKAEKGEAIYTPNSFYKFYRLVCKLLPTCILMKITSKYFE